nr:hypothetical protein [Psittaciform chaphamaparvovirus 4]
MPGGEDIRRWYAMRARLKAAGKWKGKQPTHSVPAEEEGEPPAKRPTEDDPGEGPSTPDSLPELEGSPTAEGKPISAYLDAVAGFGHVWWVHGPGVGETDLSVAEGEPRFRPGYRETAAARFRGTPGYPLEYGYPGGATG